MHPISGNLSPTLSINLAHIEPSLREFRSHWNVAIGDLFDEIDVWVVQHDVEMLDGMDALQALPVFEPYHIFGWQLGPKRFLDKFVNLPVRLRGREACCWILIEFKLGPDDKMDYFLVDSVRPVVVEDFDIL